MSDLAIERQRKSKTLRSAQFTLTSGSYAYKGHGAALVRLTGKVVPWDNSPGLVHLGVFAETVDATSAAKLVNVDLLREINVEFFENDSTAPISATTGIGGPCFMLDNHTVTADGAAGSLAGTVWAVDSVYGVGVEKLHDMGGATPRNLGPTLAFTAGDVALETVQCGAVYSVPTTATNSTVSLPAASPDGTWAFFVADGSANGHTVQYRDVTTAITAALTASKRHMVQVQKTGGKWFALSLVSP